MLPLISTSLSTECVMTLYLILLFIYSGSWTLIRVDGSAFLLLQWVITSAALLPFVNAGVMSLSMCIQEPVLLLLDFYWLPLCPLLPIFIDFSWLPPCSVFSFSLRWSGLLSASSVQFSKSVTRIQSTGLCCPTVSLIVGRICHPKFKWLILFNPLNVNLSPDSSGFGGGWHFGWAEPVVYGVARGAHWECQPEPRNLLEEEWNRSSSEGKLISSAARRKLRRGQLHLPQWGWISSQSYYCSHQRR